MMRRHLSSLSKMTLVLSLVACARNDAPAGKDTTSQGAARTSAGGTTASTPQTSSGAVTATDIAMYRIDMKKMRSWASATKAMQAAFEKDPAAAEAMGSPPQNETPSQQIARMERSPLMVAVLRENGMTPREYVMTMASYLQAAMVASVMSANPSAKVPDGQNAENIKFVQQNRAELEGLLK